jgi:hypothetical protein
VTLIGSRGTGLRVRGIYLIAVQSLNAYGAAGSPTGGSGGGGEKLVVVRANCANHVINSTTGSRD